MWSPSSWNRGVLICSPPKLTASAQKAHVTSSQQAHITSSQPSDEVLASGFLTHGLKVVDTRWLTQGLNLVDTRFLAQALKVVDTRFLAQALGYKSPEAGKVVMLEM